MISRQTGLAYRGLVAHKLPAGDYTLVVRNQNHKQGAADMAINFYASDVMPTIPIKANGEPKPPAYHAPATITVKGWN